ncbi:MAG: ankyrin repeat protein, partial [Alteromonas naphthalenivorans]
KLLLEAEAYINACNDKGETPLNMARQNKKHSIIVMLSVALEKVKNADGRGACK